MHHIPNIITILRIIGVPVLVLFLIRQDFANAFYLAMAMAVSDALDGFLAKRFGWQSKLGGWLDPLADKLMLVSAYAVWGVQGLLPVWLVALVIGRDALIGLGCIYYRFSGINFDFNPSNLSKLHTCVQILLILAILISKLGSGMGEFVGILTVAVAITTLLSGLGYARVARNLFVRHSLFRVT